LDTVHYPPQITATTGRGMELERLAGTNCGILRTDRD
jgi:hypothetical protein